MVVDVAVVLLTYNQGKYLEKSIVSILDQKFDKVFKLYIFDDYSTDKSPEMALKFQNMFPDQVELVRNEFNLGLAKNFEKAILHVQANYIAYLEGDDYWTDANKLQKQFDFLELNPRYVLAFHDFILIDKNSEVISDYNLYNSELQKDRSQKEMVTGCLIHQNTMMFRNVVKNFPSGFFIAKNHDTFFIAYLAKWGDAGYVKCDPMHYRIHNESLWSSLSAKKKHRNGLITYFQILFYASPKYYGSLIWKIGSKIKSILIS